MAAILNGEVMSYWHFRCQLMVSEALSVCAGFTVFAPPIDVTPDLKPVHINKLFNLV
jgi:hypothetical protein